MRPSDQKDGQSRGSQPRRRQAQPRLRRREALARRDRTLRPEAALARAARAELLTAFALRLKEARLAAQQAADTALWEKHVRYLEAFIARHAPNGVLVAERLTTARQTLAAVRDPAYVTRLHGTIGVDPALSASVKT